ncbi:MAG: serine hydrolase domain-containing protein [Thermoanaerobaculia bacterium]
MRRHRLFRLLLTLLVCFLSQAMLPGNAAWGQVRGPLGAAIDRYLKALVGYGYSGAVLVARRGEIVLNQGYGLADRAQKKPFTADTLFDIASISKQFTAAAILKLEMQGKLKVEDKIARFFPSAPPDKAGITLHQLLTHTSGLPDSIGDEYDVMTRENFLKGVFAVPLEHPPGGRFLYSDAGYALLAAVVEGVSGHTLADFLHDQIFVPAGMHHTGLTVSAEDRARLAHGHTLDGDWGTSLDHPYGPDGPWWNLRGNGGILTTTGDLFLWDKALQGDAVLSRVEREKYQRPYVRETGAPEPKYAYGWSVTKSPTGHARLSHVGGNGAFFSDYRRYPEDGLVIFTDANTIAYSATMISDQIERRVFGKPVVEPPVAVAAQEKDLQRCSGNYKLGADEHLKVAAEAGRLAVTADGGEGLSHIFGAVGKERLKRFAQRDRRVEAMLQAALHSKFEPLGDLMELNAQRAAKRWRAAVKPSEDALGAWKSYEVIGTSSNDGVVMTFAKLTFEKGTRVLNVAWAGPGAEGIAVSHAVRPAYYLPEGPGRFATFDIGTEAAVHLSCTNAGVLRIETVGGAVEARRVAP